MSRTNKVSCICRLRSAINNLAKKLVSLTNRVIVLENATPSPTPSTGSGFMHVQEQMPIGQAPIWPQGAGATVRSLNTVVTNTITNASFDNNSYGITVPAGTYELLLKAPCSGCNASLVYLLNHADGQIIFKGESGNSLNTCSYATGLGRIVFNEQTTFGLYHFLGTPISSGQNIGVANSVSGVEIYSEILIWKIS